MELKDYTTEELKAEIKRRAELAKAQKEEEMKVALRCRNCKYCIPSPLWAMQHKCAIRTWGKKHPRHYVVTPSTKACNKFERKN